MTQQLLKKKKKKWYLIIATNEFNNIEIGETLLSEPEQGLNKIIVVSLYTLTNDIKRQNNLILFKTISTKDNKINTEIIGYTTLSSYVKRQIRASKSRIEESFLCKTKDNIIVRIKPLVPIKYKPKKSVLTALRKKLKNYLTNAIEKQNYIDIINSIINFQMLKDLQNELKKVYPVSNITIKSLAKEEIKGMSEKPEEIKHTLQEKTI